MTIDVKDAGGVTRTLETPNANGRAAAAASRPVAIANEDLAAIGATNETAPTNDTNAAGLNGRLQRVAQRLTSLIQLLPASIGQKAKAGALAVTLASDEDLLGRIGEVQASPTANTLLDRLKAIATALAGNLNFVAVASETHIGAIGGHTWRGGVSFARPADTTAYAVGDLIANSTVAGSVTPLAIPVARINGGSGCVRRCSVSSTRIGPGTDAVRVHLFKGTSAPAAPSVANGDNGAFSVNGIAAISLGHFDITLDRLFSDGSKGFAAPTVGGEISFDTYAGQTTLYALIEARSAITPASGETFAVALEVFRD